MWRFVVQLRRYKLIIKRGVPKNRFCQAFNKYQTIRQFNPMFDFEIALFSKTCHIFIFVVTYLMYVNTVDKMWKNKAKHTEKNHEYKTFDEMDDGEKYKVNEYICIKICWQGDHKRFDVEEEN